MAENDQKPLPPPLEALSAAYDAVVIDRDELASFAEYFENTALILGISPEDFLAEEERKQEQFGEWLQMVALPLPRPYDLGREMDANWEALRETHARRN